MQRDAVAPESPTGREEAFSERSGELGERAPAGGGDLLAVLRLERVPGRAREEDVRPPRDVVGLVEEARLGRDEVALELDVQAGLLERLSLHARFEVLSFLDPAARRTPDPRLEVRLTDQREPLAVEDEERDVVHPLRVVGRHRMLALADLALPLEPRGLPVALTQPREDLFGQMHAVRLPEPCR